MCSLTIECVLLLQTVFSYYRMCSLAIDSSKAAEGAGHKTFAVSGGMLVLAGTIECVPLL